MRYIECMRKFVTAIFLGIASSGSVVAQSDDGQLREGVDLLQQGTRLLLEGLIKELGPALQDLENMVVDLNKYNTPEILPNGDIIIRRKQPLNTNPPKDGEIDL